MEIGSYPTIKNFSILKSDSARFKIGDLYSQCGDAAVVKEECRKCYACGFSEC